MLDAQRVLSLTILNCFFAYYASYRTVQIQLIVIMVKAKNRQNWTLWDYSLSWGVIGLFTTLNSPFEFIRFRMQVMPLLVEQGYLNRVYKGCINCGLRIYRHQGIKSFFKGNLSNLMRVVPSQTLVWWVKENMHRYFHYNHNLTQSKHMQYNAILGVSASMLVSLTLYPLQIIRQLLLNRTDREGRSIWYYLRKTIINHGISGMYKGASIFSIGLVLFRGTYFGVYDTLKVKTSNQLYRWMASILASYLSILAGYPIDTVRRRLVSCKGKYVNARDCARDILSKQGLRGFYLGWPMITLQSVSLSIIFFFYDRLITDYGQAMNR